MVIGVNLQRRLEHIKRDLENLVSAPMWDGQHALTCFFWAEESLSRLEYQAAKHEEEDPSELLWQGLEHALSWLKAVLVDSGYRSARPHRAFFPPEIQSWLGGARFHSGILRTAWALEQSAEPSASLDAPLEESARHLLSTFQQCRTAVRTQLLRAPSYSTPVVMALDQFDQSYAAFECRYLVVCADMDRDWRKLVRESIAFGMQRGLLTDDMIESLSPEMMVVVPRLAVWLALKRGGDGCGLLLWHFLTMNAKTCSAATCKPHQITTAATLVAMVSEGRCGQVLQRLGGASGGGEDSEKGKRDERVVREVYFRVCVLADAMQQSQGVYRTALMATLSA